MVEEEKDTVFLTGPSKVAKTSSVNEAETNKGIHDLNTVDGMKMFLAEKLPAGIYSELSKSKYFEWAEKVLKDEEEANSKSVLKRTMKIDTSKEVDLHDKSFYSIQLPKLEGEKEYLDRAGLSAKSEEEKEPPILSWAGVVDSTIRSFKSNCTRKNIIIANPNPIVGEDSKKKRFEITRTDADLSYIDNLPIIVEIDDDEIEIVPIFYIKYVDCFTEDFPKLLTRAGVDLADDINFLFNQEDLADIEAYKKYKVKSKIGEGLQTMLSDIWLSFQLGAGKLKNYYFAKWAESKGSLPKGLKSLFVGLLHHTQDFIFDPSSTGLAEYMDLRVRISKPDGKGVGNLNRILQEHPIRGKEGKITYKVFKGPMDPKAFLGQYSEIELLKLGINEEKSKELLNRFKDLNIAYSYMEVHMWRTAFKYLKKYKEYLESLGIFVPLAKARMHSRHKLKEKKKVKTISVKDCINSKDPYFSNVSTDPRWKNKAYIGNETLNKKFLACYAKIMSGEACFDSAIMKEEIEANLYKEVTPIDKIVKRRMENFPKTRSDLNRTSRGRGRGARGGKFGRARLSEEERLLVEETENFFDEEPEKRSVSDAIIFIDSAFAEEKMVGIPTSDNDILYFNKEHLLYHLKKGGTMKEKLLEAIFEEEELMTTVMLQKLIDQVNAAW